VSSALLAVALAVAGWQGWNWYQRQQAGQASAIYGALQKAVAERDMQRVKVSAGELLEKFGGSTYASIGALLAGKAAHEAGDLKTARAQLSWAVDHAGAQYRDLARLRLATVLLDEKSFNEALKHLSDPPAKAFSLRFAELRGDVLRAQGKIAEAKAAYKIALGPEKSDKEIVQKSVDVAADGQPTPGFREMVQQKLDALGDA
jgi:predicted negative regulator of RcsB-dependent stress response